MLLGKPLVCCAVSNQASSSLPEPPHCGIQLTDRIYGGQALNIDEFPWAALIMYHEQNQKSRPICGGSLINDRYLITAAHCFAKAIDDPNVFHVRLGEWDLASEQDCQDDFCSDAPIDLDIEQIIKHENYDRIDRRYANDIALIRFARQVHYSETVRPICLPLSDSLRNRNHVGYPSYAAGWGLTETGFTSDKKLKVKLTVKNVQNCAKIYKKHNDLLNSKHICAAGIRYKGVCSGDSGGPLVRQMAGAWYLIGVVSFGPQECGSGKIPGVFTNIAEYIDWIKDKVY